MFFEFNLAISKLSEKVDGYFNSLKQRGFLDPRLCLFLVFCLIYYTWISSFIKLVLLLLMGLLVYRQAKQILKLPANTFVRIFKFSLIWGILQFLVFYFLQDKSLIPSSLKEPFLFVENSYFLVSVYLSLIFMLRLFITLSVSMFLIGLFSFYSIGSVAAWVLKPILPNKSWKISLSIVLMSQYLFLFNEALSSYKIACISRNLPCSGLKYSYYSIFYLIRVFSHKPYEQALNIVTRDIYNKDSWYNLPKLKIVPTCCLLLLGLGIVLVGLY